jgi:hypothetical protein
LPPELNPWVARLPQIAADLVVLFHLAFVVFVVAGAVLVLRWRWVAWLHVPCAVWGGLIELFGWICPLTPLEIHLRRLGGEAGYSGGFLERYLIPILYPGALTRGIQIGLGILVVALNVALYVLVWRRARGGDTPESIRR